MSMNARVSAQVEKMVQAFGTNEFSQEKERYWMILEEEYRKDPVRAWGWMAYEDPTDSLAEGIYSKDDKEWVAGVLEDYKRFWKMIESVGYESTNMINKDLIREAEEYINS